MPGIPPVPSAYSFVAVAEDITWAGVRRNVYVSHIMDHIDKWRVVDGVRYIVGEGDIPQGKWGELRERCSKAPCVSVNKWWAELAVDKGVDIMAVVPHTVAPLGVMPSHDVDFVYLNAYYPLPCGGRMHDRKNWVYWPEFKRRAPGSKMGVGYINNVYADVRIRFGVPRVDIYRHIGRGRVFVNLSGHEGFGLNPLVALWMRLRVVTLDTPHYREVLGGAPGVYFVEPAGYIRCRSGYIDIEVAIPDIDKVVEAAVEALRDWRPNVEGERWVAERYPLKVYKVFDEL